MFFKFGSKHDSPVQINCENFTMGCMVGFWAILAQKLAFTTLDGNWIVHALYFTALCDTMDHMTLWENKA